MRTELFGLLLASAAAAQPPTLPPDGNPQSFSRLPLLERNQLTGDALRAFDAVVGKDASGKHLPSSPTELPVIAR
jgi:hypothetical protein